MPRPYALLLPALLLPACADAPAASDASTTEAATGAGETAADPSTSTDAPTTGGGGETDAATSGGEAAGWHCVYDNKFTQQEECRDYVGGGWSDEQVAADCAEAGGGAPLAGPCDYPAILGTCELPGEPDAYVRLVFPGDDAGQCQGLQTGCEVFGGGTFTPAGVCEEPVDPDPDGAAFEWPILQCLDPLPGEPPGEGEGGQVCTWTMISGCTEPGRKFAEYGACETVLTQRPYAPVPPVPPPQEPDARLDDPAYVAELDWVREQVEACACVCCHQTSVTPGGASVWDIEAPGNWISSFSPYGLAFAGGFIDSSLLGAYPAEQNNGFTREGIGIPSTDPARMIAFFAAELNHRGIDPTEFADDDPTPKPFYDQSIYEPAACDADQGVDADGTVRWTGGPARYIYVLDQSAANPGVPPNLDLPAGTRWRLDARAGQTPRVTGEVKYGELPPGLLQGFPAAGEAAPLESGQTYYLYVLADIGVPITRCLFDYAG
ncbi:MAG: proteinase inhibitor [Myxococcales bacterium]|nr:proteinase inhibitor [Myxococcales bacterium]